MPTPPPTGPGSGPNRPNPFFRKNNDPFAHIRRNHRIKVPEVRVIGPDGRQLGVIPTEKAIQAALAVGLDLVEVSPNSVPPVCRILDFGKYKYEESKKQSHVKSVASKIKEVKMRPNIDPHDLGIKLRHAEIFLFEGSKVKLTLQFRGRELAYKEVGFETMRKAIAQLTHIATQDNDIKLMGRSVIVTMTPVPLNKRKLKLNEEGAPPPPPPIDDDDDDEDDDLPGQESGPAAGPPAP